MKAGERSLTSDWVAAARALYSEAPPALDVAEDPMARRLLGPGLAGVVGIAASSMGAAALSHRVLGALTLGLVQSIPLRSAAIDDVVREGAARGVRQLVLLGAGLDARAWRLPELVDTTVFELDHETTQEHKRSATTGVEPLARAVRFCSIDFESERPDDVLREAGFDASEPATFVWEGVTMYLTPGAISATMDSVARAAAPGAHLAMTYVPPDFGAKWKRALALAVSRIIDEELRGWLTPVEVRHLLRTRHFEVISDDSGPEWAARYWPAGEVRRVGSYERLVVARRS